MFSGRDMDTDVTPLITGYHLLRSNPKAHCHEVHPDVPVFFFSLCVGADGRASQRGDGAETQPRPGPQRQGATAAGKAAHCLYVLDWFFTLQHCYFLPGISSV